MTSAVCLPSKTMVNSLPGLQFEQVRPEFLEILEELFERNFSTTVSEGFDPFPLTSAQARFVALERHEDLYYIALLGARAIGMSMLRGLDEGFEIPSFGIFIDVEYQGQGFGRWLTVWTIDQARKLRCGSIRLSVYADNLAAYKLYVSLGFVERERQRVVRASRAEEKIVMYLELED